MLYMIIEKFHFGKVKELYQRFAEKGRMMPEGMEYVDSWITDDLKICYQIIESDSPEKIQIWIDNWKDIVDFEVVPVITSAEAREKVFSKDK